MAIKLDSIFDNFNNDPLVKKICNLLMRHGKKTKAEYILQSLFNNLQNNYPGQALDILYLAVLNLQNFGNIRVRPQSKKFKRFVFTRSAGTPYFISPKRSQNLSIRSIFLLSLKFNSNKSLSQNLSQEIIFAATNKSDLLSKRFTTHSLTRLNKRHYNYRWKRKLPFDPEQSFLK